MTLPQRPEGMSKLYWFKPDNASPRVVKPMDRALSQTEADYIVSLVNNAPAIEAELSALREARREQEELRTLVRRMWERDILSSAELDAIENEMVRLGCISNEERRPK
jgi:hypothetical protein